MEKLDYVKKSLPIFFKDFDKHFELVEGVRCKSYPYSPVLIIKGKDGRCINAYWMRQLSEVYVMEILEEGLAILWLRNHSKYLEVYGV